MSNCHYCASEHPPKQINDHGTCYECNFATCADPSGRVDGYFHGEQCQCGCRRLVCEFDVRDHTASEHTGDDLSSCFPTLVGTSGRTTFAGTANALATDHTEELFPTDAAEACTRLLNLFHPGRAALIEALGPRWDSSDAQVFELDFRPDDRIVRFNPSFFTVGTLERILALSGRILVGLGHVALPATEPTPLWDNVRDDFTEWGRTGEPPSTASLARWAEGADQTGILHLRSALATNEPPSAPFDLARWILEAVLQESIYA